LNEKLAKVESEQKSEPERAFTFRVDDPAKQIEDEEPVVETPKAEH